MSEDDVIKYHVESLEKANLLEKALREIERRLVEKAKAQAVAFRGGSIPRSLVVHYETDIVVDTGIRRRL